MLEYTINSILAKEKPTLEDFTCFIEEIKKVPAFRERPPTFGDEQKIGRFCINYEPSAFSQNVQYRIYEEKKQGVFVWREGYRIIVSPNGHITKIFKIQCPRFLDALLGVGEPIYWNPEIQLK